MPFKSRSKGRRLIPRQRYRVTNWREYDAYRPGGDFGFIAIPVRCSTHCGDPTPFPQDTDWLVEATSLDRRPYLAVGR
jgi:hypothetical protein